MTGNQHKKKQEIIINSDCLSKVPHSHHLPSPRLHLAENTCRAWCSATLAAAGGARHLLKSNARVSYQMPNRGGHNEWLLVKTSSTLARTAQSLCYRNGSGGANCPQKNKSLHPTVGVGLSMEASCRPLLHFPTSLAGVYPAISPLPHSPGSFCKRKRHVKWVACVLGEETVCTHVKMHREQRIRAEILQTAPASPQLECFLPSPHSACNRSGVHV